MNKIVRLPAEKFNKKTTFATFSDATIPSGTPFSAKSGKKFEN
jgi:hypothetical protein